MRARRGAAEWLHEGRVTRLIEVRPATPAANGRPLPIANQPAGTRARRIPPSSRPAEPRTVRRRPRQRERIVFRPAPGTEAPGSPPERGRYSPPRTGTRSRQESLPPRHAAADAPRCPHGRCRSRRAVGHRTPASAGAPPAAAGHDGGPRRRRPRLPAIAAAPAS